MIRNKTPPRRVVARHNAILLQRVCGTDIPSAFPCNGHFFHTGFEPVDGQCFRIYRILALVASVGSLSFPVLLRAVR